VSGYRGISVVFRSEVGGQRSALLHWVQRGRGGAPTSGPPGSSWARGSRFKHSLYDFVLSPKVRILTRPQMHNY